MSKIPVYLNVYDLHHANSYGYPVGLGAFHSGVEITGKEYSFGGHDYNFTGVFEIPPKSAGGASFRESVLLGETTLSRAEIQNIINQLALEFVGNSYHPFTKNCNSFSNELSIRLFDKPIPAYVNRLPYIGSVFSCMIPPVALQMLGLSLPSAESMEDNVSVQASNPFAGPGNSLSDELGISEETEEEKRERVANAAYKRLHSKGMS